MVVEDEIALAGVLGSYLEREGFEVHLRHDGRTAVASAREVDPDIVVLDLGLPSLDGIEVCRQLRTFSDAYVVMLTAVRRRRRLHDQTIQSSRAGSQGACPAAAPATHPASRGPPGRRTGAAKLRPPVGRRSRS